MKKLLVSWAVITCLLFSPKVYGQVNVNINISSQPDWGPSGYDYVEYYYIPEMDMYYYVPYKKYLYSNKGKWVWVSTIPSRYSHYDIYQCHKVVINKPHPYYHHHIHQAKYKHYKQPKYHGKQQIIRDHPQKSNLPKNGAGKEVKGTDQKSNLPKKGVSTPSKTTTKSNLPKKGVSNPTKSTPSKSNLPKKATTTPSKSTPVKSNLPKTGVQKSAPQKSSIPKNGVQKPQQSQPQKSSLPKSGAPKNQGAPNKSKLQKSGKGGH